MIEHLPTVLAPPDRFDDETLEVDGDIYRHLFRSRRLAVGDALRIVDGAGRARAGRVESVDRRRATIALGATLPSREPAVSVSLWVGAPRPERADWLVEKATELGVDSIHWLQTARSRPPYAPAKRQRLDRMARSAVEQCSRSRVPWITSGATFDALERLEALEGSRSVEGTGAREKLTETHAVRRIALVPGAPAWPQDLWAESVEAEIAGVALSRVAVAVGPEGGWSPDELERLAAWNYVPAGLGERLLRVETAALVALGRLLS